MRNILFTSPADQKILDKIKTITARYWRIPYGRQFQAGDLVTLSTGRKKETRFATAKILRVVEWDGYKYGNASKQLSMSREAIAKAEGFGNWDEFIDAYYSLNAHNLDDPYEVERRSHFFIEFEVQEKAN